MKREIKWKRWHIDYLKNNHKTKNLEELRIVLGSNLRLVVNQNQIRKKLKSMGLSVKEFYTEEAAKRRREQWTEWTKQKRSAESMDMVKGIIERFYKDGGAKLVQSKLKDLNLYYSASQINYRAKKYGVARDHKQPPPQPQHSLPLNQLLTKAYYAIENFNEVNGTNFNIFSLRDGGGEVIDSYLANNRSEAIVVSLVGILFGEGYKIQKKGATRFYIWGD